MSRKITQEQFIALAKRIHGDAYSYEKTVYTGKDNKVIITCRIHGDFSIVASYLMYSGCGCQECGYIKSALHKRRHGETHTALWSVYYNMKHRCETVTDKQYKYYGAKGVTICEEWSSFASFSAWAHTNGYSLGMEIDRIDPSGNYQPSNCRFVLPVVNANNKRDTIKIMRNGVPYTFYELSCLYGTSSKIVRDRWNRLKRPNVLTDDVINKLARLKQPGVRL